MRLLIDTLMALTVVALAGGGLWYYNSNQRQEHNVETVRSALDRLHDQAAYQGALGHFSNSPNGFPVHMMPEWFGEDLPVNVLLTSEHPWIDLAPPGDHSYHPPDPVARSKHQAGFWYNPNLGLFRARVPDTVAPSDALAQYNAINYTDLSELPFEREEARQPLAYRVQDAHTQAANWQPTVSQQVFSKSVTQDSDDITGDSEPLVIEWTSGQKIPEPTIHEEGAWTLPDGEKAERATEETTTPLQDKMAAESSDVPAETGSSDIAEDQPQQANTKAQSTDQAEFQEPAKPQARRSLAEIETPDQ